MDGIGSKEIEAEERGVRGGGARQFDGNEARDREMQIWSLFPEMRGQKLSRDVRLETVLDLELCEGIPVLRFPGLKECDFVEHLVSTRAGGVSTGMFSTMNFSISLGDSPENVKENYRRIAKAMHCRYGDMVGTRQTHTTNIRRVTVKDMGNGIAFPDAYQDVDGLVTNIPGITLACYGADCVPLLFVDTGKRAIGVAHSGWRGTAGDMAGRMVRRMGEEYGTDPSDLRVAIGPSICQSCYEVDQQVADVFLELLGDCGEELEAVKRTKRYRMMRENGVRRPVEPGKEPGKFQMDLWLTNLILLMRAGVAPEQVEVTDLCTCHNPGILFSHRASRGKRGNLGAFLKIRQGV